MQIHLENFLNMHTFIAGAFIGVLVYFAFFHKKKDR